MRLQEPPEGKEKQEVGSTCSIDMRMGIHVLKHRGCWECTCLQEQPFYPLVSLSCLLRHCHWSKQVARTTGRSPYQASHCSPSWALSSRAVVRVR